MPGTAFATASTGNRVIVGPASTAFGFKCWYLVCFHDAIVAVRQSLPTAAAMAYSTDKRLKVYGALAQLFMDTLTSPGRRMRQQIPARLQIVPDSQLRSRPNVVIPTSQVRFIILKSSKIARYGTVVTPEINLEMKTGKKLVYGIYVWDFEKVCSQMWQTYPQLCK